MKKPATVEVWKPFVISKIKKCEGVNLVGVRSLMSRAGSKYGTINRTGKEPGSVSLVDIGRRGAFVVISCERCVFVVAANACLRFHFIAR